MGYLIIAIVVGIIGLAMTIFVHIKDEENKWLLSFVGLILIVLSIFGSIEAVNLMKYGKYSELVKEYEMDYKDHTYTKGNLIFEYHIDDSEFENTYHIFDKKEFNINYQMLTSKMIFPLSEEALPLIINNLKENAEYYKEDSYMTIINNHFLVEIRYSYDKQTIDYNFTEIREYRYIEEYNDDTEQKERVKDYNPDYKYKYVKPELHINHVDDNYQEFDASLLKLLFGYDSNNFTKTITSNEIIYKIIS